VTAATPILMVLEYVAYGDLRAVLRTCREQQIAVRPVEQLLFARQVASALEYLAAKAFVHRDVAARNILVGQYCEVKLADFGLSRQLASDGGYYRVSRRSLLPVKWMAPEALDDRKFSAQTDVWAFGVVLWEIYSNGKTPYGRTDSKAGTRYKCYLSALHTLSGSPLRSSAAADS
jgi:serine/threonine protein kinase